MVRFFRRLLPVAGITGALLIGAAPAPAAAESTSFDEPRQLAGQWIATQFQSAGTHSAGSAADTIIALAATGGQTAVVDEAVTVLADTTPAYIGAPGAVTNVGGLAKVMLAVQISGADPTGFAGYDLEDELRQRIDADGSIAGVHPFVVPLAIAALARTSAGVPEETGQWYTTLQCQDDQHVNYGAYGWGSDSCSTADTDITAMALQVLLVIDQQQAAQRAVAWLLADQSAAGGFGGNDNANSTGLAGQALRAVGETAAADRAAAHITKLQFGVDADPAHVGGIRWLPGDTQPNLMATYQAVLAWGAASFPHLVVATEETPVPTPPATGTAPPPTGGATQPPGGDGGELPVTGEPLLLLLAVGASGLLVGVGLVWGTRRRWAWRS